MFIILLIILNFKQYSVSWRRLCAASQRQLSFSVAKKTPPRWSFEIYPGHIFMNNLILYLLSPLWSRRWWLATRGTGSKPFTHLHRYLLPAKTGKQNARERCKSLFYTHNIYTFIKDGGSSTGFFLSPATWMGRFARDALAKRLVLRRSKFKLFNVTFDVLRATPSHLLRQKHPPEHRARKIRKTYLIFRQTIQETMRSNFCVPKNAHV